MSFCIQCGAQLKDKDLFCTQCGKSVKTIDENTQKNIVTTRDQPAQLLTSGQMPSAIDNQSGQGKNATVPAEINKWNWGAFLITWIWGIGNNTWIALLAILPIANMAMPFVLGAKGSAWAWKNKQWESVEHFKEVQRKWAKWGLIIVLLLITFIFSMYFFEVDYFYF